MNFHKAWFIAFIASLFLICLPPAAYSEQAGIHWYSYKDGMEKIKKENKKGFLHFYTSWCTFCKLMNANTFTDKKVIAYLNENFIPIRVNAEEQQDIARQYQVNRFPNNFFLAEDTSTVGNRPGYIPADIFLDMLTYVETNTYKTITFSDYMKQKQAKKESSQKAPKM